MKKILFYLLTFIYLLFAFQDMPPGWRHRLNLNIPVQNKKIWSDSKGDTIVTTFYNGSKLYLKYSENDGFSWSDTLLVRYPNNTPVTNVGDLSIAIDRASNIYLAIYRSNDHALVCLVSHNMGRSWQEIFTIVNDGLTGDRHPWLISWGYDQAYMVYRVKDAYNHSVVELAYIFNGGNNYIKEIVPHPETTNVIQKYPRIAIGKDTTIYIVYNEPTARQGGNNQGMLARKEGGTWYFNYFPFPHTEMAWIKPNKLIIPDENDKNILHALIYVNDPPPPELPDIGLYYLKSNNKGSGWNFTKILSDTSPNMYPEADFVVDNEKIMVLTVNSSNGGTHLFESYDNGNAWSEYPNTVFNTLMFRITDNRRSRIITFNDGANNDILSFISNDKLLLSSSSFATAYNNAKHLVRKPNSDDLYIVYTMQSDSSDVCFSYSTDGGNTWEPYEIIGHGVYPSINISQSPGFSGTYDICVVFAKGGLNNFRLLLRTRRVGKYSTDWSQVITLNMPSGFTPFQGDGVLYEPHYITSITTSFDLWQNKFLHVVLRARDDNSGELKLLHVMYNISNIDYQNTTQLSPTGYSIINTIPSYPSIACSGNRLHLVWQYNNTIYYSESQADIINWTPPFQISQYGTNAYNPFIEAYGDSVYVTWSIDEGTGKHEVYRRSHYKFDNYFKWSEIENVSLSPSYDSRYPTNAEGEFEVWIEETSTDYDPYYKRGNENSRVLKDTREESYFPHSSRYKTQLATYLYSIFTEKDHLVYRIVSAKKVFPEPSPTGNSFSSYSASDSNSPYLVYREGTRDYGGIRGDIGQILIYKFPLDTGFIYKAQIEFYFQGNETRKGKIILQNAIPFEFTYRPNLDERILLPIHPLSIINDTLFITIKNSQGAELSLKSIRIFRYEKEENNQGPQTVISQNIRDGQRNLLAIYNHKNNNIEIKFKISKLSPVEVSLFDPSGRKVRTLIKEDLLPRGSYVFRLIRPQALKSGIYFMRLRTGDRDETAKIIIN